jgi:hypothetical protein
MIPPQSSQPSPYSAALDSALAPPNPNNHANNQARDEHGKWIRGHGGKPHHTQSPTSPIEHSLETLQWGLAHVLRKGDNPKTVMLKSVDVLESLYPKHPVWPVKYAGRFHAIADLGTRFVDVVIDETGAPTVQVHDSIPKELHPQQHPME